MKNQRLTFTSGCGKVNAHVDSFNGKYVLQISIGLINSFLGESFLGWGKTFEKESDAIESAKERVKPFTKEFPFPVNVTQYNDLIKQQDLLAKICAN